MPKIVTKEEPEQFLLFDSFGNIAAPGLETTAVRTVTIPVAVSRNTPFGRKAAEKGTRCH